MGLKFRRKFLLTTSLGVLQRSYSTRSSGDGKDQDISNCTVLFFLSTSLTLSASTLNIKKDGMEISDPEPSSAMMGSEVSQLPLPFSATHFLSSHRHVLSAIITPAAPDRCAFRTFDKRNIEKNESHLGESSLLLSRRRHQ
jgi:hypothetical protein